MKQLLGAVLAVSLLVPGAAFAAEATGVLESWDVGKRVLTLKLGLTEPHTRLACTVNPGVNVPAGATAGRNIYIIYTGEGAGDPGGPARTNNKCSWLTFP